MQTYISKLVRSCLTIAVTISGVSQTVRCQPPELRVRIASEQRLTPKSDSMSENEPIRVQAVVEQVEGVFLVDTGAAISLVDANRKRYKNQDSSITLVTPNGNRSVRMLGNKVAQIGIDRLSLLQFASCNLEGLSQVHGCEIKGILGFQLVSEFGLGYDSKEKYFHLGMSSNRVFQRKYPLLVVGSKAATDSVRLYDDRVIECMIDTGYSGVLAVTTQRFDELIQNGFLHDVRMQNGQTINGTKTSRLARAKFVEAFGHRFENVPIGESTSNLVGLELLRRFSFFIDVANSEILISDGIQIDNDFLFDMSGISMVAAGEKIMVYAVRENSPAANAGVSRGDEIVEVNYRPVIADWETLHQTRIFFSRSTSFPLAVKLRSKDGERDVVLR